MTKRQRDPRFGMSPPWRRYVVFCKDGRPTGWAMGISEEAAIQHWVSTGQPRLSESEIERRWKSQKSDGYAVRAVDLTLAPEGEQA